MSEQILPSYGGQAVIEGVMMRGAKGVAIAMRDPDDNIVLHTEKLGPIYNSKLAKIPFLRGLVMLWMQWPWHACPDHLRNTQGDEDEQIEGRCCTSH